MQTGKLHCLCYTKNGKGPQCTKTVKDHEPFCWIHMKKCVRQMEEEVNERKREKMRIQSIGLLKTPIKKKMIIESEIERPSRQKRPIGKKEITVGKKPTDWTPV